MFIHVLVKIVITHWILHKTIIYFNIFKLLGEASAVKNKKNKRGFSKKNSENVLLYNFNSFAIWILKQLNCKYRIVHKIQTEFYM